MAQTIQQSPFSLDESLHRRWFWVALMAIGYVLAVNSAILALGTPVVLLSLPTALLPLIPAYVPTEKRFRMTIIMSILVYITVIGILLGTSYLGFSWSQLAKFSTTLFFSIPSFFVRGPLQIIFGYSQELSMVSGGIALALFMAAIYKLPKLSDQSIRILLSVLIVAMAMGVVETYQLGIDLSYMGDGFYYDGLRAGI